MFRRGFAIPRLIPQNSATVFGGRAGVRVHDRRHVNVFAVLVPVRRRGGCFVDRAIGLPGLAARSGLRGRALFAPTLPRVIVGMPRLRGSTPSRRRAPDAIRTLSSITLLFSPPSASFPCRGCDGAALFSCISIATWTSAPTLRIPTAQTTSPSVLESPATYTRTAAVSSSGACRGARELEYGGEHCSGTGGYS